MTGSTSSRVPRGGSLASPDGTRIAYELFGAGRPYILVGGMLSDRATLSGLASAMEGCSAVTYDRRGRGDSTDTPPYTMQKEIDDLKALAGMFAEPPVVLGHSSGAGLAIEAVAAGLAVAGLVLYEPPYGFDDAVSRTESGEFADTIIGLLDASDHRGAIGHFFTGLGLPRSEVEALASDPGLLAKAPTMAYDLAIMGQTERGGTIPVDVLGRISVPALVLTGEQSPDFFKVVAGQIAGLLQNAELKVVPDADHTASAPEIAKMVVEFGRALS